MSAVMLSLLGSATTYASTSTTEIAMQQSEKTTVKAEELPEAIKTTLKGTDYAGWTVSAATLEKGVYSIELKKGDQKNTVNLDKDGKKVK